MFRKPREASSPSSEIPIRPSTGRPPTPPNGVRATITTMSSKSSTKPLTPRPNSKTNAPLPKSSVKKPAISKTGGKPNNSILNFFKKVDSPLVDDSIFVSSGRQAVAHSRSKDSNEELELEEIYKDEDVMRFNEVNGSVKRRKTSIEGPGEVDVALRSSPTPTTNVQSTHAQAAQKSIAKKAIRSGFAPDSDSEEDNDMEKPPSALADESLEQRTSPECLDVERSSHYFSNQTIETPVDMRRRRIPVDEAQAKWEAMQPTQTGPRAIEKGDSSGSEYNGNMNSQKNALKAKNQPSSTETSASERRDKQKAGPEQLAKKKNGNNSISPVSDASTMKDDLPQIPCLKQEATSVDEWGRFDDLEEFADDEFGDGEEFTERKWMQEQARLEAAEQQLFDKPCEGFEDDPITNKADDVSSPTCPLCSASLADVSDDLATRHVNGCLDGNLVPLPAPKSEQKGEKEMKFIPPGGSNRFIRKAAIPRPGQINPIQIGGSGGSTNKATAFSEIMSGKAEDAAWASAAAAENSSRGKPAYERVCPFYKIMPGFFICVDAFRYGAVKGCNAYFLSHFHSDHYIGLTASWCHGPIYCSKVTANLVKQQLRVDPKWVVALDFDAKSEVPNTQGVYVTNLHANHCPGSSLFLFEKAVGKGPSPKVQRILHCGDFRACPAHIAHPRLMPDIIDSITGKTKQQKIDVCYLDTTYLNPRYAFPSQEEVIKACADMCVSLKKDRADESDAWEVVKKQRAGAGMNNFVQTTIKPEDDSIAMEIGSTKPRGRLLVVCGTYSIGKERICMGIARALDCKIWAPPGKMRICAALEDPELMSRMTDDPKEAQIHMQMLMEIRAETLQEYLNSYKPHFSRIVGFRPSGWNYRPPNSRFTDSPSISTILNSSNWKSTYAMAELVPQRGSTREASCFGVPYSEHSSFRELTMFVCALRIEKVVPTVNVGSAAGRAKMKGWIEKWLAERRKGGVIKIGKGEGEVRW